MSKRLTTTLSVLCFVLSPQLDADDRLPSWNDTAAKSSIVRFVSRVTDKNSEDFVPSPERIAVFDNDGTLWAENPSPFQLAFAVFSLKQQITEHPEWSDDPFVEALLEGNVAKLLADGHKGLFHIMGLTHSGMTVDEFNARVAEWATTDRHPRYGKSYLALTYQPMQELLVYLRENGFKTYIVSGGGCDFMRVWAERVYGIPPEQVVGSQGDAKFEIRGDKSVLVKTLDTIFVDDKEGKPVGIHKFIGRRPIAAFGNSDGDQAMLEYTTIGNPHPSFGLIVHHTDAEREYAYDAKPRSSGKLVTALADAAKRDWTVVDMRNDWKVIFKNE